MRVGREQWRSLHPEDVAWVTEWQLAAAFPWIPLGCTCPIEAAPVPEPGERSWRVQIHTGVDQVTAELPIRELSQVVRWCYSAPDVRRVLSPPARVLAALRVLRRALRPELRLVDPLARMGYGDRRASGDPAA